MPYHSASRAGDQVYLHNEDALDHWSFDRFGWHLKALRQVPLVGRLALVAEGGLTNDKYEELMTIVAEKYGDLCGMPRCLPNALGGDTRMVLPMHDLSCETEFSITRSCSPWYTSPAMPSTITTFCARIA